MFSRKLEVGSYEALVVYCNGCEVGDIRTANQTFKNVFVVEKTSLSGDDESLVVYWNGCEVGDIRTAHQTFNSVFVLEKTSLSGIAQHAKIEQYFYNREDFVERGTLVNKHGLHPSDSEQTK